MLYHLQHQTAAATTKPLNPYPETPLLSHFIMHFSPLSALALSLGAAVAFQLNPTRSDAIALRDACEVFDSHHLASRDIEKRCNYDGCDDCSNNFVSCVQCLNGNNIPACIVCLSYCAAECGC
ncbi:uncharacterized protein F5Z01DRAFT_740402 [Emericellopsis atlantica]|uniref:Uncharacterized protein n=1 Tax=Emericellopsis atlantica TaxID=2614577 RepID=A0A9P7ZDK3_9HYPO|nr:uncharacterized protein F5Z01DRAFT_740402 [Emericellopsis atlantica]KAG9249956.1 hypothetical protein F5Z01DRAFT_740402 [Emericellopsis atlantica]